jgi:MbtH protein
MFDDETADYFVVINDEEQYSIWPARLVAKLPDGWSTVGDSRSREDALAHIEQVWTDMRPKSLRTAMDEAGSR